MIHLLSNKSALEKIDDHIIYTEFVAAIQAWSENTSTPPSGRHLGHCKVLLSGNRGQDHPEEEDYRQAIMQVYYEIATFFRTGTGISGFC
jgi:hypothetical protein